MIDWNIVELTILDALRLFSCSLLLSWEILLYWLALAADNDIRVFFIINSFYLLFPIFFLKTFKNFLVRAFLENYWLLSTFLFTLKFALLRTLWHLRSFLQRNRLRSYVYWPNIRSLLIGKFKRLLDAFSWNFADYLLLQLFLWRYLLWWYFHRAHFHLRNFHWRRFFGRFLAYFLFYFEKVSFLLFFWFLSWQKFFQVWDPCFLMVWVRNSILVLNSHDIVFVRRVRIWAQIFAIFARRLRIISTN